MRKPGAQALAGLGAGCYLASPAVATWSIEVGIGCIALGIALTTWAIVTTR